MINRTTNPLVLVSATELRRCLRQVVAEAGAAEMERREGGWTCSRVETFESVMRPCLGALGTFSGSDLIDVFALLGKPLEHYGGSLDALHRDFQRPFAALRIDRPSLGAAKNLVRWWKFTFVRLWAMKAVLLPMRLMLGSAFDKGTLRAALHPTATCHLDNPIRAEASFGLRLTLASRWYDFADIDLDQLGEFQRFVEGHDNPGEFGMVRTKYRGSPFTAALRTYYEYGGSQGFRYSKQDIDDYVYWMRCIRAGTVDEPPSKFVPQADARRRRVAAKAKKAHLARKQAAQVVLIDGIDHEEAKTKVLAQEVTCFELGLHAFVKSEDPDAPFQYLFMIRRRGSRKRGVLSDSPYPLRMHAYPQRIWDVWEGCFHAFMAHSKARGKEAVADITAFRNFVADYICLYLPWWCERRPEVELEIPADPSLFGRFGWWVSGVDDCENPVPLLDFIARFRKGKAAHHNPVSTAFKFFEYCRAYAPRHGLALVGFDNPVVPEIDRGIARGRQKTSKIPILRSAVPYLMRYAYECEAFFMALQQQCLNGTMPSDGRSWAARGRTGQPYPTRMLGAAPTITVGSGHHSLDTVPCLASWETRQVAGTDGRTRPVLLPVVTGLRLVVAALETGIRFQGLQWIDQRTFDLHNRGRNDAAELWSLLVSTDKAKERPWTTYVVSRVRDLLLREKAFQDLMADDAKDIPVPYEGRSNSRFGDIVPLFRRRNSSVPITDQAYVKVWELLLTSFQHWYNGTVAGAMATAKLHMFWYEPVPNAVGGEPMVEVAVAGEGGEYLFCPIALRLRHTPHSARATFISARASILPVEDIQSLVGHCNASATYYYSVECEDEVAARIRAAADAIWNGEDAPIGGGPGDPVHIRADEVNSALRRSFVRDRARTEAAFGFTALSLLNDDTADADGIARLRSSSMAQIAFRETHICPVGERCPAEVMDAIREPRRCGLCPLAVKSVDHVTAIGARMRVLLERIGEATGLVERMTARREPPDTIEEINERRKLDALEYAAWKTALETLSGALRLLEEKDDDFFLVGMPDAVRLHLRLVVRDDDAANFVLARIVDSHRFPVLETSSVRAQAAQLRWRLLSSAKTRDAELDAVSDADPVRAFLDSLRVELRARGLEPTFAAALTAARAALGSPASAPALLGAPACGG